MSIICPTILAQDPHDYRNQIERVAPFAKRIQIDLADGKFAPNKTVDIKHVWWPEHVQADLHMMYRYPARHLKLFVKLKPHMVIVHVESECEFMKLTDSLHSAGIKAGVALLQETALEAVLPLLPTIDHILVFGGTLGHFGGHADLKMLEKVKIIKSIEPRLEVGWDGGINDMNIEMLVKGGVDVLNVGGFVQHAPDPATAYATLKNIVDRC